MKRFVFSTWLLGLAIGFSTIASGDCGRFAKKDTTFMPNAKTELTEQQKAEMQFMWEEEKLAKEVYMHFSELYGARIFSNISQAETRHQRMVERLLASFKVELPTPNPTPGEFVNPEVQQLYEDFITKGELSLQDALEVGQMIEVRDIADLEAALKTAPPEASNTYQHLLEGSRRHLAAFERQLSRF